MENMESDMMVDVVVDSDVMEVVTSKKKMCTRVDLNCDIPTKLEVR